ncbi:MAG: 4Fe-4S binding protein [Dehalobacter sp.]|nr:4Fe-4S binding protein [Dehalobacter sp.]
MYNNHITINSKLCHACWKCILSCKKNVLGKINLPFHKHVKIAHPNNCVGCYQCEKVCEYGAITRLNKETEA